MNHDIELRTPTPDDAAAMWQLVRDDGTLDVNSPYAYLLVCTDYADTSLVATDGRGVVGFVSGYRPPAQPDDLFVWQIGVHRRARRRGLGRRLLKALLDCPGSEGATSLTATVTPDNEASMALFERFAANLGVPCERSERFAADLFPAGDHSAEFELRIHPLPPADRRELHEEPIVMKTARQDAITRLESDVRSYGRMWPATFETAQGSTIWDTDGNPYIDLFAGAGSLNYGHNDPQMRDAVVEYLTGNGIVHSLDVATVARRRFLEKFEEVILEPHGFDWKVQFPGPTGTNAVEAAMKLARKYTGREHVVGFTNAFHGMTLGSLSVSGNSMKREGAGVGLGSTTNVPYDGYFGDQVDTMSYLDALLADDGSGFEKPAAVIVETVQAEGGLATASPGWLRRLREVCTDHGVLLIVDDIQAGCGRTGPFFSFDVADIEPDIVTLSKSLSGFGMPFAVTLMRHDLDVWEPGEHNGTFRGFNPGMVTAAIALDRWADDELEQSTARKATTVATALDALIGAHPEHVMQRRGRGLIQGIACADGIASAVAHRAYDLGVLVETSGPNSEVLKLLPALTIPDDELAEALQRITTAVGDVVADAGGSATSTVSPAASAVA